MDSQERLSDYNSCQGKLEAWIDVSVNNFLDEKYPPIPVFMLFVNCLVSEFHSHWNNERLSRFQSARIVACYDDLLAQSDRDWVTFDSLQQFVRRSYRQSIRCLRYSDVTSQTKVLSLEDRCGIGTSHVLSKMCLAMACSGKSKAGVDSFQAQCKFVICEGLSEKLIDVINLRYDHCFSGSFELDFEHAMRFVSRLLEISKLSLPPSQCFPMARKEWELFRENDLF
jgi:hypothetical protein